jgi:BirA family transcriptional regulator, biotin operon repressor / biotin---[acetyl-CoA-carboxylase] ligase
MSLLNPTLPSEGSPGPGAAAAKAPRDPITAEAVLPLLLDMVEPGAPWVAGLPFEFRAACESTNAALKRIADGSRAGTTIVTDEQTCGRGRLGRTWLSEPGVDLTFSVLLRPRMKPARGHLLALATGVAVAEVLEQGFGLEGQVSLKWPNDVLLGGKKVCGILLEASADADRIVWAVAGVGLNVNSEPCRVLASLPPERAVEWQGRPQPVSLKENLGFAVPRAPLLAALLARLTWWWTGLDWTSTIPTLLAEWRKRDALAGRLVDVSAGADRSELVVAGLAAGIGEEGQLLIRTEGLGVDGALLEVFAGDVSVTAAVQPLQRGSTMRRVAPPI